MRLGSNLRDALAGEMTPKFLATVDPSGQPNCVPVISVTPYDDETLVFGEFMMNKSKRNLLYCDKVAVTLLTESMCSWSLRGRFLGFETSGDRVDFINHQQAFRYNAYSSIRAAGVIRVEEVSEKASMGKMCILGQHAKLKTVSTFFSQASQAENAMVRQVIEKFSRLAAVRAVAYLGEDNWPVAFISTSCRPAGKDMLLLSDSLFRVHAPHLSSGAPVAVAVLTPEPIAYQVKGFYRGLKAGIGTVDVKACYSASPPLPGDQL